MWNETKEVVYACNGILIVPFPKTKTGTLGQRLQLHFKNFTTMWFEVPRKSRRSNHSHIESSNHLYK